MCVKVFLGFAVMICRFMGKIFFPNLKNKYSFVEGKKRDLPNDLRHIGLPLQEGSRRSSVLAKRPEKIEISVRVKERESAI